MDSGLPGQANIVIIGGGAIGCSVAYHLAKMGAKDVVLVEKSGLTHGATWHAAGLVGQLRASRNVTRLLQLSVALYGRLEAETGQAVDWKPVGSLRLASSQDRWTEIRRAATTAKSFGLEMHLMGPKEAKDLFPVMTTTDVVGAAFIPSDGQVDPASLTQALAKGARQGGVKIHEGVRVTGIEVAGRRAVAVVTDKGTVRAETVVNCAGMWGRQVGAMAGVNSPALAVEHQYLITEPIPGLPEGMPTMRDPDNLIYYKADVGAISVGGYEAVTPPFGRHGMPPDFARELLPSDFDRFEPLAERAAFRTPVINEVGVRQLLNGPIPGSPDGEFIMGRAPELDNFFVACGFFYGIAGAGGAGQRMAEWIIDGEPGTDLWPLDVRRFGDHHGGRSYMAERGVEMYGKHYAMGWPEDEQSAGRGGRRSPLYRTLKDKGAVYGSKFGWERPNWFAPDGIEPVDRPSFGRPNWFDQVGEEHRAVRERVALIDQTSFAKFELAGAKAFETLQCIAANDLDRPPGNVVYTQFCNARGGVEADLTITRIAGDRFYIVTGSGFGVRDSNWITRHMPHDGSVHLTEVTSAWGVINLCGPHARDVLSKVCEDDVSNAALPFGSCGFIRIGYAPVRALRVGYVGELGWELHIPTEYVAHVYELLWAAGQDYGIADVGYRAIESLRLEKGYVYWSADITPDYTPYEAGVGFCVALDAPGKGDFIGGAALAKAKQEGPRQTLCRFTLEADAPVRAGACILRAGKVLGVASSGGYGYTIGKPIAYGYVPADEAGHDDYEIEVHGETYPAKRLARAAYDPGRKRILA
jgi:4-methylaminobutanoate oxidase (formaldehyde-forming)